MRNHGRAICRFLTPSVAAFAVAIGTKIVQDPPRDPESKGIVERTNGYIKRSFIPGRHFNNPQDVQDQRDEWFNTVANTRTHATLKTRPIDLFLTDQQSMRPLPLYTPTIGIRPAIRLPRNTTSPSTPTTQYSVDPAFTDRLVTVCTCLEEITVTGPSGEIAACHQRYWSEHHVITDPAHQHAARRMRQLITGPQQHTHTPGNDVEVADLTIYDSIA